MTLPYERTRAVNYTAQFLLELTNPKNTPKVPKYIRDRARALLRHYPTQFEMELVSEHEDERRREVLDMQIFGKEL